MKRHRRKTIRPTQKQSFPSRWPRAKTEMRHLTGPVPRHIVNTASIAGLNPGSGPVYAASKHAVVALSEELFKSMKIVGRPVG